MHWFNDTFIYKKRVFKSRGEENIVVDRICRDCESIMEDLRIETIASTKYHYFQCKKCNKKVIRREN